MIEETGVIVAESRDGVWVQTIRKSTCSGCSARHGCGQGVLARLSDGRANQLLISIKEGDRFQIGEEVMIGIEESLLLRASFVVYGLPLLMLVLSVVVADGLWPGSESMAVGFAITGLALGFLIVRLQGSFRNDIKPVLLRRGTEEEAVD